MQGFRSNISANTVQLFINQAFSFVVFYFLSKTLSKNDFGELNWTLAIFLSAFAIISFGLDQFIIKKIAAGENAGRLMSLHFFHVFIMGGMFYAILILLSFLFPSFFSKHSLLILLGLGKLFLFYSTPFKSIATGKEHFRAVLYMSVSSTILKGLCILFLFYANQISLYSTVLIYIVADFSELVLGFVLARNILKISLKFRFHLTSYFDLLKEAYPQIGVVIFSSALARIDWILIGFFLTASKMAEYSFAYKAFEISTFPLLIIAPLLIPYFTRLARTGQKINENEKVQLLLRAEMIIACLVALCLNIVWNPLVDNVTNAKYGALNTTTVFILSTSLPVLYLNNFLWSMHFAYGHLKLIFYSFIIAFFLNLAANIILIPLYGNEGAAFSYLLSVSLQTVFYLVRMKEKMKLGWQSLLFCSFCAVCSGLVSKYSSLQVWWLLPLCISLYILLLFCTIQLRRADWPILRQVMRI